MAGAPRHIFVRIQSIGRILLVAYRAAQTSFCYTRMRGAGLRGERAMRPRKHFKQNWWSWVQLASDAILLSSMDAASSTLPCCRWKVASWDSTKGLMATTMAGCIEGVSTRTWVMVGGITVESRDQKNAPSLGLSETELSAIL